MVSDTDMNGVGRW